MVRLNKKGVDEHGLQWFTEGYLFSSVVIAKDTERKEIIEWISKRSKIQFLSIDTILSFLKDRGE